MRRSGLPPAPLRLRALWRKLRRYPKLTSVEKRGHPASRIKTTYFNRPLQSIPAAMGSDRGSAYQKEIQCHSDEQLTATPYPLGVKRLVEQTSVHSVIGKSTAPRLPMREDASSSKRADER